MNNPLKKRFKRELINDLPKNLALFLFLGVLIAISAGYIVAGDSLLAAYDESFDKYNIEDGHFILSDKPEKQLLTDLEKEGISIYPLFFKNKQAKNKDDVRFYPIRHDVNRQDVMEGGLKQNDEIAVDRLYAENNSIRPGDLYRAAGKDFTVCGTVALSDYSTLFQNNTDSMFDANHFTVALVTDEAFNHLDNAGMHYCYAYTFNESGLNDRRAKKKSDRILNRLIDLVDDENGSTDFEKTLVYFGLLPETECELSIDDFVARQDNQAIYFTGDDFGRDRVMMEYLLYIIMGLLAYIFAVTTKSSIECEASAIGTLRALGFTRAEILIHYLTVPTAITLLAALIGNICGYTFVKFTIADLYYHSYSLPGFETVWSADAFVRTTVMPCTIVILMESIVIGRMLRLSPLDFLKHNLKKGRTKRRAIQLKHGSFFYRLRIRVILQNKGAYAAILFGVLFANLLLAFGLIFSPLLKHYEKEVEQSMTSKYQYVLKEPKNTETKSAEKYSMTSLESDRESVTLYGLKKDSSYFENMKMMDILPDDKDSDEVIISSAYADKYKIKKGDEISLHAKYENGSYVFNVSGIYDYPATMCVYMPIDQFNETFDFDEDSFTGYFSDEKITDIDDEYIAATITEQDLAVVSRQLEDSMGMMFPIFGGFATALYILTIYLLAKVVVERNEKSISMLKILGFTDAETSRIFNTATALVVIASMIVSIPIISLALKGIYALLMLEIAGYITYYIPPWMYPAILAIGIGGYLLVHLIQMHRIRRIPLAIALKDME